MNYYVKIKIFCGTFDNLKLYVYNFMLNSEQKKHL